MTEKDNNIIKPNKYHNGKIYTIRCRDDDTLIYVGSSCLPLHKRFYEHKKRMKQTKHKKTLVYAKMNELGVDKFYIELYELFKCNTKEELNKREGEVIRKIGTMNTKIEGRTKEEIKQYRKEYQQKPEMKEYKKKYNQIPEVKNRIKQYYQTPEMKKYKNEKIECVCGCFTNRGAIARHKKSQKHIDLMNKQNNESN